MALLTQELITTPTPDEIKVRLIDPSDVPADLASYFSKRNADGGWRSENPARLADLISRSIHHRGFREPATTLDAARGWFLPFQCKYVLEIQPTMPGYYSVRIIGVVVKSGGDK